MLFSGTSFTNELLYLGWSNGDPECRKAVKITAWNPHTTFVFELTECTLKCIPTFFLLLYPPLPSSTPIFTISCMCLFSTVMHVYAWILLGQDFKCCSMLISKMYSFPKQKKKQKKNLNTSKILKHLRDSYTSCQLKK